MIFYEYFNKSDGDDRMIMMIRMTRSIIKVHDDNDYDESAVGASVPTLSMKTI